MHGCQWLVGWWCFGVWVGVIWGTGRSVGSRGVCCDSCCAVVFLSQGFEVYSSNHGSQAPSRVAPPPFRQEGRLQAPIPPSSYVGQSGWPGRFFPVFLCSCKYSHQGAWSVCRQSSVCGPCVGFDGVSRCGQEGQEEGRQAPFPPPPSLQEGWR